MERDQGSKEQPEDGVNPEIVGQGEIGWGSLPADIRDSAFFAHLRARPAPKIFNQELQSEVDALRLKGLPIPEDLLGRVFLEELDFHWNERFGRPYTEDK